MLEDIPQQLQFEDFRDKLENFEGLRERQPSNQIL